MTKTSVEWVDEAIRRNSAFKDASAQLRALPKSNDATSLLIEAYNDGRAPPWMVAHLLGCARGSEGYPVVMKILLAAPGLLAESYAGASLARISPEKAREDLPRLVVGEYAWRTCEGAAYGIGVLGERSLAIHIAEARRRRRISQMCATLVLGGFPEVLGVVEEWLDAAGDPQLGLALDLAATLSVEGRLPTRFQVPIERGLRSDAALGKRPRRQLREWAAGLPGADAGAQAKK